MVSKWKDVDLAFGIGLLDSFTVSHWLTFSSVGPLMFSDQCYDPPAY